MRLKGRRALITGAGTGIGKATAIRFAREGASVAINYLDSPEKADETLRLAEEASAAARNDHWRHLTIQADVSQEQDVLRMFGQMSDAWGGIDVLVNNAGIQIESPSDQTTLEDFEKVVAVNLRGAFLCAREALRDFKRQGRAGVILNNSSVHERIPKPGFLGYSVSKGGLGNLTRTLALEYARDGIRVNGVAPGAIATPINEEWADHPETRKEVAAHIPMRRVGTPEEIAAMFAFLASDEAAYITGRTVYVDGGLACYPDFQENWSS